MLYKPTTILRLYDFIIFFYKKDLKLEVENVKITIALAPRNS